MKTDNIKCSRCGHVLNVDEKIPECDGAGEMVILSCLHCGAKYECYEQPDEQKKEFEFYHNGEDISGRFTEPDIMNGHCINCGHEIFVQGNFCLSDSEDLEDEDDDKMSYNTSECPYCGMNEVRWDTSENEKKNLDYWKENNL